MSSNHKLTPNNRQSIQSAMTGLLNRTVKMQELFCPLGAEDATIMATTEEDRAALAHLHRRKFYVATSSIFTVWVDDPCLTVPAKIAFRCRTDSRFPVFDEGHKIDLSALDDDNREKFVGWVNAATRQHRIVKAAIKIANQFLMLHGGDSVASLRTRWPEFMTVLLSLPSPWPERAREVMTVRRSEYGWPQSGATYDWYLDNMRNLEIVGGLLAGAQMMDVPGDPSELIVSVVDWRDNAG
jgi:hypothetical protein